MVHEISIRSVRHEGRLDLHCLHSRRCCYLLLSWVRKPCGIEIVKADLEEVRFGMKIDLCVVMHDGVRRDG